MQQKKKLCRHCREKINAEFFYNVSVTPTFPKAQKKLHIKSSFSKDITLLT